MELVFKGEIHHDSYGTMHHGATTENRNMAEEYKVMLLESYPELFEEISFKVEVPEKKMVIETPEGKMANLRKK